MKVRTPKFKSGFDTTRESMRSPSVPRTPAPYQSIRDFEREEETDTMLLDMPRVVTYEEGENEYYSHKKMLLKKLKKARKSRKEVEILRLESELTEWMVFGKSMGFEVTRYTGE